MCFMKSTTTIVLSPLIAVVVAYSTVKLMPAQNSGIIASSSESAYDRVMRTGVLRCGYGISPPALVKDVNTGKISGLDYAIWEAIGKQLGIKIEWAEEAGWGNFIEGLRTKRYDAFCSQLWPDPNRSRYLSLSIPIIYSFLDTYVRADDHRFDSGLDSINQPIATIPAVEGDVSVTLAQNRFPKAKILTLPQTNTVSDMFLSVITKKADVIFVDQGMFASLEKSHPGVLRKVEGLPPPFVFASYYGVKNGEFALRDMINVALRTMMDDGSLERIAHGYSPDYIPANKNYK
jgi:ABC-type amino acid transport substrate-binding protein